MTEKFRGRIIPFVRRNPSIIFFISTTILGYFPWVLFGRPIWFIYGMTISGLVLTFVCDGIQGIVLQLRSAINVGSNFRIYLEILVILLIANISTVIFAYLLFRSISSLAFIRTELYKLPVLLVGILLGGPIFEELFGLRGFVLPKLLEKYNSLAASVFIGIYFGLWHLVEFYRPGSSQYAMGLGAMPWFVLTEVGHSVLMTMIYIRTNGNLFISGILFHLLMSTVFVVILTDFATNKQNIIGKINFQYIIIYSIVITAIATLYVIKGRMYYRNEVGHI